MSDRTIHIIFWIAFILLFFIVFAIDLHVNKKRHATKNLKSALAWTLSWMFLAFLYAAAIYYFYPHDERKITATNFISGYLTEYSLSIDNLFIFIMIFSVMSVKESLQPRLLQMGILLSIVLRVIFILFGIALITAFHWILYIFGAILLWTAWKMAFTDDSEKIEPDKNILYRWLSHIYPVDHSEEHTTFFIRKNNKRYATNLFLVFILIGSTDVIFAIDSIPAVMGITQDPFVVITSNIFALMGLISLFFAVKGIMQLFHFLKYGVSFLLFFIGLKMLAGIYHPVEDWFKRNSWVSLVVIAATLVITILLSVIIKKKPENT